MTPDGGQPAADVAYGVDIGGTKVLGVALGSVRRHRGRGPGGHPEGTRTSWAATSRRPSPKWWPDSTAPWPARRWPDAAADGRHAQPSAGPTPPLPRRRRGRPRHGRPPGRLCFAPNLPQAQGVDWNDLIGDQLPGRRLLIENDANFAVLAEHRLGAARGYDHVVMVTLGTGIGGGLMIDGRVQVGGRGFAGEIGHMVVDPAGPPCPCGRRGCWERFASGAGLGVLAREAALAGRLGEVVRLAGGDPESVRGEDVSAAAAAGDPAAQRVIREVGWWIGFGLANLAAVLDPGVLRARRRGDPVGRPPARVGPCHVRRAGRGW